MILRNPYHRNQSQLYKITSPKILADRLGLSLQQLHSLASADNNYICWIDKKTGRQIQRPKPLLAKLHSRIGVLLARIDVPEYLHSAIKGRSYISNASSHDPEMPSVKIDVKKFYPSIRAQAVYHFFKDRMLCAGDVAGILTKLLTVDGHLPTGSSASPILSYFAYEDMFAAIAILAAANNCTMTCYVDDLVFTGPGATRKLLHSVKLLMGNYKLKGHKTKVFKRKQPRVLTGVVMTQSGRRLPNRRQRAIADDISSFSIASNDQERLIILRRLVGRLYEATQIDSSWRHKAEEYSQKRNTLESQIQSIP